MSAVCVQYECNMWTARTEAVSSFPCGPPRGGVSPVRAGIGCAKEACVCLCEFVCLFDCLFDTSESRRTHECQHQVYAKDLQKKARTISKPSTVNGLLPSGQHQCRCHPIITCHRRESKRKTAHMPSNLPSVSPYACKRSPVAINQWC